MGGGGREGGWCQGVCVPQLLVCIFSGRHSEETWVGILAPVFPCCVALGQWPDVSEPPSPQL